MFQQSALIELSVTIGGTLQLVRQIKMLKNWIFFINCAHKIGTCRLESFQHLSPLVQVQVNGMF